MTKARQWGVVAMVLGCLVGSQAWAAKIVVADDSEQYLYSMPAGEALLTGEVESLAVVEGGSMALLDGGESFAFTTGITNNVPCWIGYDPCTTDYRLPLGVGWGGQDDSGNRSMVAKATQSIAYCGAGNNVGFVTDSKNLVLYWPHAFAIDMNPNANVMVKFRMSIYENTQAGCAGTNSYLGGDTATCVPSYEVTDWMEAYGDGRGDCEGSYSDPGNCHLPDVLLMNPGATVTKHYAYTLYVDVCTTAGTGCTTNSNSGCFSVDWF